MSSDQASHTESAFHAGEQAAQARVGMRERMEAIGPRVLRSAMPAQHRAFFSQLPFVALGAADAGGRLHATLLSGRAGFVTSPTETALDIAALPLAGDPLADALQPGAAVGLLGIELQTRRRNRANGHVTQRHAGGFTLQVTQSFGNCPKYIQRRDLLAAPPAKPASAVAARAARELDTDAMALVRGADTFFIASHAGHDAANGGADVSHRGGRPGFVRVDGDGCTLTWPDFVGNFFFNTVGNLISNPAAALVFPDFTNGDLLHVGGRAEIVWEGPELADFRGAERLLRLHVDHVVHRPGSWPLRWSLVEVSPFLE